MESTEGEVTGKDGKPGLISLLLSRMSATTSRQANSTRCRAFFSTVSFPMHWLIRLAQRWGDSLVRTL